MCFVNPFIHAKAIHDLVNFTKEILKLVRKTLDVYALSMRTFSSFIFAEKEGISRIKTSHEESRSRLKGVIERDSSESYLEQSCIIFTRISFHHFHLHLYLIIFSLTLPYTLYHLHLYLLTFFLILYYRSFLEKYLYVIITSSNCTPSDIPMNDLYPIF